MDFTLWYFGPLRSGNSSGPEHKHEVRMKLDAQLAGVWKEHGNIYASKLATSLPPEENMTLQDRYRQVRGDGAQNIRDDFAVTNAGWAEPWRFVPLLQPVPSFDGHTVPIDLSITMLRPSPPGSIIHQGGDIDNRLKTLFDALHPPQQAPAGEAESVFCLLKDDLQIASVTVTTRQIWEPVRKTVRKGDGEDSSVEDENGVILLIDVSPHHQQTAPDGALLGEHLFNARRSA